MKRKIQLGRTINIYFLISLIIPLMIISVISTLSVRNYMISITRDNHLQIAHNLSVQVDDFFDEPAKDIMVLRDILQSVDDKALYSELFRAALVNQNRFSHLEILTSEGIIEYSFPENKSIAGFDYSTKAYFQAIKDGESYYWSNTYIDTFHDEVAIDFAVPMNDQVLVATIHLEKLYDIFNALSFDDHVIAGITDNNGVYIAHTDHNQVMQRETDPYINNRKLSFDTVTLGNEEYYASSSISSDLKWYIVLYEEKSYIMSNINRYIVTIVSISIASLFVILIFGTLLNKSIISNFNRFISTTKEIAIGNYDITKPESNFYEIEDIIINFMTMVEKIKEREETILEQNLKIEGLNSDLENRVIERTNDLVESNKALEKTLEDLKSAQTQLIETEKLASLGNLVAGLAHEINTPIGVTYTAITYMQKETDSFEKLFESGELTRTDLTDYVNSITEGSTIISQNIKRTSELISSFKLVSVDQTNDDFREFSLCKYLSVIVKSLNPNLRRAKIDLNITCDEEVNMIANPGDLSQVITNLIMNTITHAYDYEGGKIDMTVEKKGEFVEVTYRDYGAGISDNDINHVFEPFYTTIRGEGGSGLGLNIIYNIVSKSFNGSIKVESEIGKGTTFTMMLKIKNGELPVRL